MKSYEENLSVADTDLGKLIKEAIRMTVYFVNEKTPDSIRLSKTFDYPENSDTMHYMIRRTIRKIVVEDESVDAVIINEYRSVSDNLVVTYRLIY